MAVAVATILVAPSGAAADIEEAAAIDFTAVPGVAFTNKPVATFKSSSTLPGDFTAEVNWGDGESVTAGEIVGVSFDFVTQKATYRVDAGHTYAVQGTYPVTITIDQYPVDTEVVAGTATVAPEPTATPSPSPSPSPEPSPSPSPSPSPTPEPPPSQPPATIAVAPPPITPPTILSAGFSSTPRVGQQTTLIVRATAANSPVAGYRVNLGEADARYGALACSLLPVLPGDDANPFAAGAFATFRLPVTFLKRGRHRISVVVSAGRCTGEKTTTRNFTVTVAAPRRRRARASAAITAWPQSWLVARAAQAGCSDTEIVPTNDREAGRAANSAICLINAERARRRLSTLAVDVRLRESALAHTLAMVSGKFFSHQGPSEPPLEDRGKRVRYSASMGENIGFGGGTLATPTSMLDAWMDSPPHRANILEPKYKGIGMGVIAKAPTGSFAPAAAYTTNFGTDEPAAGGSGGSDGSGTAGAPDGSSTPVPPTRTPSSTQPPAIKVTASTKAFRGADSGPSATTITPGTAPGTTSPDAPGMQLDFQLAAAAKVNFTVQRIVRGRRVGRRCVAPKRSNRRRRACKRRRRVGAFSLPGQAGLNQVRFTGRVNGRKLAPGSYVLVVVADGSKPRSIRFRIRK